MYYLSVSLVIFFSNSFMLYALAIKTLYGLYNMLFAFQGMPIDGFVELNFGSFEQYLTSDDESWYFYDVEWIGLLVLLEQRIIGNKKLEVYANIVMGIALSLHPKSAIIAAFYYA